MPLYRVVGYDPSLIQSVTIELRASDADEAVDIVRRKGMEHVKATRVDGAPEEAPSHATQPDPAPPKATPSTAEPNAREKQQLEYLYFVCQSSIIRRPIRTIAGAMFVALVVTSLLYIGLWVMIAGIADYARDVARRNADSYRYDGR